MPHAGTSCMKIGNNLILRRDNVFRDTLTKGLLLGENEWLRDYFLIGQFSRLN
jgi:hypothetical protein